MPAPSPGRPRVRRAAAFGGSIAAWVVLFRGPSVVQGAGALGAMMRYAVGREERTLQQRFGGSWEDYARRVRRWL